MRHKKSFNHLSRTASHRKAMLANMASSLILHKRIKTTTAKAKALRTFVEPLITKSKDDSTNSRRVVFTYLQDKDAVSELFREISPKIADRPGGYTRILKLGSRLGDNADMCLIELVDYNENLLSAKSDDQAKSGRRRRRGARKKGEGESVQNTISPAEATSAEKVKVEAVAETIEVEAETVEAAEVEAIDEAVEAEAEDQQTEAINVKEEKEDNSEENKSEEDKKE